MRYNRILLSLKKKKKGNPVISTTWMNLEGNVLSEISQTKTNTLSYHLHLYVEP